MKKILIICGIFVLTIFMIPVTLSAMSAPDSKEIDEEFFITVFRDETDEFEEMELERYLVGVVAAEMPALFDIEALKAQAIASRTYALRILEHNDYILDTVMHQVFHDEEQLRERWGADFDTHHATITEAVMATRGMVITYNDALISPLFFALSNGRTENSEDFFENSTPYLRSTPSKWDMEHENFAVESNFSLSELRDALETPDLTLSSFTVSSETEGGNVAEVQVGSGSLTGREVREALGLRSSAFSITRNNSEGVTITTYGHGHGVGMSQNGANFMAREGYTHVEILKHYYENVQIVEKSSLSFE